MSQIDRLALVYDQLKASRKVKNKEDFAVKLGYNRSYVSELFNSRKPITSDFVDKLNEIYNINKEWLLTGEGEMFNENPSAISKDSTKTGISGGKIARLIRYIAFSETDVAREIEEIKETLEFLQELKKQKAEKKNT